jgi:hypothetical protein
MFCAVKYRLHYSLHLHFLHPSYIPSTQHTLFCIISLITTCFDLLSHTIIKLQLIYRYFHNLVNLVKFIKVNFIKFCQVVEIPVYVLQFGNCECVTSDT